MSWTKVNDICKECHMRGPVWFKVTEDGVAVRENIAHKTTCSHHKGQPTHLKRRGGVRRQERRAAELISGKTTVGSGNVGEDGDARSFSSRYRVECKQTSSSAYRLAQSVWGKLCESALAAGEEPVLHIQTTSAAGLTETILCVRAAWWGEPPELVFHCRTKRVPLHGGIRTPSRVSVAYTPELVIVSEDEFRQHADLGGLRASP